MAETFTLEDFQDTKQQAPLSFDESDFAPGSAKPSANGEQISAYRPTLKQRASDILGDIRTSGPVEAILGKTPEETAKMLEPRPTGLIPNVVKAAQDIPKAAALSPADLYGDQTDVPGAIGKELLSQVNLGNLAMLTGIGEAWKAANAAKDIPKIAAMSKALIGAYFSTQGAKGASEAAGQLAGAPQSPSDTGKSIAGIGMNALMAFAPVGEFILSKSVKPFTKPPYSGRVLESKQPAGAVPPQPKEANASNIETPTEIHGDVRTQPVSGEGELPIEESGGGVQPQAAGRLPETPANAPEQPPLEVPKVEGGLTPPTVADLPPVEAGKTRIFSGNDSSWGSTDPARAAQYAQAGNGNVHYVDVPDSVAKAARTAALKDTSGTGGDHLLPNEWVKKQQPVSIPKVDPIQIQTEPEVTAESVLSRPRGTTSPQEMAALPDTELDKMMPDIQAGKYRVTEDATRWAMNNPTANVKELESLRDQLKQRKTITSAGFSQWFGDAIHALKKTDQGIKNIAAVREVDATSEPIKAAPIEPAVAVQKPAAPAQEGKLPKQMFARIKGTTQTFPVESLDDAARKYSLMRVKSNAGASQLPPVDLLDEKGKQFARISYNGKVWDMGGKLLYDPFAKQIEPPSPSGAKPTPPVATGQSSSVIKVYHGGTENALESNWPKWFTTSKEKANAYTQLKPTQKVFEGTVNPKNPLYSKVTLSAEDVERAFQKGHDAIIIGSKENPIDVIVPKPENVNLTPPQASPKPTEAVATGQTGYEPKWTISANDLMAASKRPDFNAKDWVASKGDKQNAYDAAHFALKANISDSLKSKFKAVQREAKKQGNDILAEGESIQPPQESARPTEPKYISPEELLARQPKASPSETVSEIEARNQAYKNRPIKETGEELNRQWHEQQKVRPTEQGKVEGKQWTKEARLKGSKEFLPARTDEKGLFVVLRNGKEIVPSNKSVAEIRDAKSTPPASPVAKAVQKVEEQSPEQVLENHPNVKVTLPKSVTMVRVTDTKGNQYVTGKKEIESGNVYQGAGVKKVEAGTIGKDKKFIPSKEPVTIEAKPKLVGMGAALAGETAPNPNSPTSIKNAQTDIERAKRGLPPAMQPQRRAFGQVWDEAMAAVDHDPGITDRLVDELKNHPRSVSDFEDALLLHKQIELQNDYGTLTRDLAQAYEDAKEFPNRQADVDELNVRVAGLSDRMQELYDINKKVGTETARGLNARKMMAYEDYSLAAMELQKRAANQGRPLSEGERVELQKAHDRIAELQKQYDDLVAKNEEKQTVPEIENVLKQTKARTPRGSTEELAGFDKTKEKIGAALEKGDRSSINGLVQKLVRAFVEENPAIQRDELVDKVHGVLREFDPEFSRRDTMDAISGYGDFKPLRKDLISNTVRDLKGQLQQIGKLEDMAAGEAPKKTGVERRTPSDEERRLIKQVEEAKRKGGYKVTDPAAQLRTALQAVKTRLENQIKDLEFQLQRRQKIVRTRTPIALDAAAESLKARRDELKSQYDAMFPREPISDAQRLANWKTRTQNRIATLQDKLANGDFAKRPVRPPPELDAEAQKIQTELFRAKQNFQRGLIEDRLRQRPMWIKAQDTFLRWYRGGLLSSPVVFAKLTAAAIVRAGLTPVEEVVGGAISKLLPKLAARAPREGYWNSEAEAKAITSHLTKGRLDAWDVLTKGETELDILYGKGREGALGENQVRPFSVADIPGRAHGAFKASTKRAEFERSLTKRLAYEIRNGADGSSPAVQLRSAIEAYKDANRSIFLQDNRVVSAWQAAIRRVEQASKLTGQPSPGGKTVGTIMRTAVPIVRVPSNIVAEALQFATGSVTGSARLGLALRQGIDTLPPEQADLIMRELKKGSLGGAVLITGFLLPHIWGGFYQANQKKKPGQIANNAARIGGVNIPASALHNPIFEVAQAGATARMIADKNQAAGALAIPMGAKAASLGLIEETPFIREMLEAGRAFNPNEQNAYFGELAKSMTVPQLVQWMATRGDVDAAGNPITRKPKTFMQHIEAGIPGLRENVPSKEAAANWASP